MGHNIKTVNRSEAINRNAARLKVLAEKIETMGGLVGKIREELVEQVDLIIEQVDELETGFAEQIRAINDRLDLIERPIWRKIMDKVKEKKKKEEKDPPTPNHRAVVLDVHSVKHTHEGRKVVKKGEKEDGPSEPSDN